MQLKIIEINFVTMLTMQTWEKLLLSLDVQVLHFDLPLSSYTDVSFTSSIE